MAGGMSVGEEKIHALMIQIQLNMDNQGARQIR
jgi:hypothetical protein